MPNATPLTPGEAVAQRTITAYTLTPEQFRKSEALHRIDVGLTLVSTLLEFAVLAAIIGVRFVPRLQRLVARLPGSIANKRFVQAAIFVSAVMLILSGFQFPLRIYSHHIALAYGLSVQGWGSWLWDRAKGELLALFIGTLLLWGLYAIIRRVPVRWWLYAWLCAVPIMVAMVFVSPVLIDPLFNRFEPLADTRPELASQLRNLAFAAGLDVPPERIYLMHASEKVTTYNAYVTGFGATKRIVVWDTTARDLTLPQTLFVFAHEMGHYQLHHIYLGLAFGSLLAFAGIWLTARLAQAAIGRYGQRWQIPVLGDWSSLPLLLLLAGLLSFFGEPPANGFSRWEEHQADLYALAITHPVFVRTGQDPAQIAAQSFQVLGEKSYSYPNPSRLLVLWSYSHPPIAERIRFVLGTTASAQPQRR